MKGDIMYDVERLAKIINILQERKSCSVKELARELMFSEATIRRDLTMLAKQNKIVKTHGGAVIRESFHSEVPYNLRSDKETEVKQMLAKAAAELIHDNMTIFLDASSTVEYIVPYLESFKDITVVTNNPDIPSKLASTGIQVYSTGGKYLHSSNSYVGEFARNMISNVNADLLFFSARGVSTSGLVTISSTDDDIHRAMISNSEKTCLLFDSSKYGKTYRFTVCNLSDVDILITDSPLSSGPEHPNIIIADK
jgi:DeoR/GlpR family transcriptional regulator of sugar metabolism